MKRNKPLAAQTPPPPFANDVGGFWSGVLGQNAVAGLASLLSAATAYQSDVATKGRLLTGQIEWTPCPARWNGCDFTVSLSDAQFLLVLESGGDAQQGRLTVLLSKLQFGSLAKGWPDYGDTIKLQAGGVWHEFVVAEIIGQHDDNDPGLTLFLEKEQNAIGN